MIPSIALTWVAASIVGLTNAWPDKVGDVSDLESRWFGDDPKDLSKNQDTDIKYDSGDEKAVDKTRAFVTQANLTTFVGSSADLRGQIGYLGSTAGTDRRIGSAGHNQTLDWVLRSLSPFYYDLEVFVFNTTFFPCTQNNSTDSSNPLCETRKVPVKSIIATTKHHQLKDNAGVLLVGSFADTVAGTRGVNAPGSGLVGSLAVAKALQNFKVLNPVAFTFWSGLDYDRLLNNGPAKAFELLEHHEHYKKAFNALADISDIKTYIHVHSLGSKNGVRAYDGSSEVRDVLKKLEDKDSVFQLSPPFQSHGRSVPVPWGAISSGFEPFQKTDEEAERYGGKSNAPYDPNAGREGDTNNNVDFEMLNSNVHVLARIVADHAGSQGGLLRDYQKTGSKSPVGGH